jgi:archaellum component FlaG (FlaF/FlaG flagellin family)
MTRLPLILSIAALLCATGLGIAAKGRADQKTRELATAQSDLKTSRATLVTRTNELGKANEGLATAGKEIEAKTAEVAKVAREAKAVKEELEASVDTVKKRDDKVADLEIEIKEAGIKMAAEEAAKTALQAQLTDAQKELAESKLAYEEMKKRADERLVGAPKSTKSDSAPPASLTGTVRAVNEGLNFLVLNVGDRQGVSVHTSMLVVRGGQRVATLKVTSIEPRESIAEIVPGTLARGQQVQVGDRVVLLRGERKGTSAVPTSAPAKAGRGGAVEPALPEA